MSNLVTNTNLRLMALGIIEKELVQAAKLVDVIDDNFVSICNVIFGCKGKVIVSGIGKSGHIGKKMAATFASTGTPSFFVHLVEALHGDLGMAETSDIIILISNSGGANEFKMILPLLKKKSITTIAITQNLDSFLAKHATYSLSTVVDEEACPLGLAPTSSAVNTLILGDALALTVMTMKGFNKHDYALSHPAGALGNSLLMQLEQLIDKKHQQAFCSGDTTIADAIELMCQTGLGLIAIVEHGNVIGVFTDGDLRRVIRNRQDLMHSIDDVMTHQFKSSFSNQLCSQALKLMTSYAVTALPIVNIKTKKFMAVVNINTIHQAGIY